MKSQYLRSLKNYRGPRGVRLEAPPDGEEVMTLSLYGVCGRRSDMFGGDYDAESVAAKLAECGGKPLTLRLNSPGGDAFEGLAIHNLLADYAGEVTCKVDGMAASAASIIAMAADTIKMGAGAQIMIHCAWSFAVGNSEEIRKCADDLEKTDKDLAKLYAKRMGASEDEVMSLMRAETYFTGEEAVAARLADEAADDGEPDGDEEPQAADADADADDAEHEEPDGDEPQAADGEPEGGPDGEPEEPEDDDDVKALLRRIGAPTAKAALLVLDVRAEQRKAQRRTAAQSERERLIAAHADRLTPRLRKQLAALKTTAEVRAVLAALPPLRAPRAAVVEPPRPASDEILTEAEIYVARKSGVDLDKARAAKIAFLARMSAR